MFNKSMAQKVIKTRKYSDTIANVQRKTCFRVEISDNIHSLTTFFKD